MNIFYLLEVVGRVARHNFKWVKIYINQLLRIKGLNFSIVYSAESDESSAHDSSAL